VLTLLLIQLNACKTSQKETAAVRASKNSAVDLYRDGFSIFRREDCGAETSCGTYVTTRAGRHVYGTEGHFSSVMSNDDNPLSLDKGQHQGQEVFTWPAPGEVIHRDYERLKELMTQYSQLVGTSRNPDFQGTSGEFAWRLPGGIRDNQWACVKKAGPFGSDKWCEAVVDQFVNRFVPSGSKYRQYGNCGEGARVGVCLAKRAGFRDDEIKLCEATADHVFAIVKRDPKWCVLERWDIENRGHFFCDVEVDSDDQTVRVKNKPIGHEWYQGVTCYTLNELQKQ